MLTVDLRKSLLGRGGSGERSGVGEVCAEERGVAVEAGEPDDTSPALPPPPGGWYGFGTVTSKWSMLSSGDLAAVLPCALPAELVRDECAGTLVWAAAGSGAVLLAASAPAAAADAATASRRARSLSRSAAVSADIEYVLVGFSRTRYFLCDSKSKSVGWGMAAFVLAATLAYPGEYPLERKRNGRCSGWLDAPDDVDDEAVVVGDGDVAVAVAGFGFVIAVELVDVFAALAEELGVGFSSDPEEPEDESSSDDDDDDDEDVDEDEDGLRAGVTVDVRGVVGGESAALAARRLLTVTTGDRGDRGDLVCSPAGDFACDPGCDPDAACDPVVDPAAGRVSREVGLVGLTSAAVVFSLPNSAAEGRVFVVAFRW